MNITIETAGPETRMTLHGLAKTIHDSELLKSKISDVLAADPATRLSIYVEDSFVLTSSMIGTLIRFIQHDRADIILYVRQSELYELLADLNLTALLNVRQF